MGSPAVARHWPHQARQAPSIRREASTPLPTAVNGSKGTTLARPGPRPAGSSSGAHWCERVRGNAGGHRGGRLPSTGALQEPYAPATSSLLSPALRA